MKTLETIIFKFFDYGQVEEEIELPKLFCFDLHESHTINEN